MKKAIIMVFFSGKDEKTDRDIFTSAYSLAVTDLLNMPMKIYLTQDNKTIFGHTILTPINNKAKKIIKMFKKTNKYDPTYLVNSIKYASVKRYKKPKDIKILIGKKINILGSKLTADTIKESADV